MNVNAENYIHFSVDDWFEVFQELAKSEYKSIFEDNRLLFMKKIHEEEGAIFSCFCFFENANHSFSLEDVPNRFADEFSENSNWLKFGFHGLNKDSLYKTTDYETAKDDYYRVIKELYRITGSKNCIDTFPRIHFYSASLNACMAWKAGYFGIIGLLTSEDDRKNYYLDFFQNNQIKKKKFFFDNSTNISFCRTAMRLENEGDVTSRLIQLNRCDKPLIIFTHESYLGNLSIQNKFKECAELSQKLGIKFSFPMYQKYK